MKTLLTITFVSAAWFTVEARACDVPALVVIPDGTRVSTQQLNEVRADVYDYMAAMDEYLACLEEQVAAAGGRDRVPPDYMTLMINRHNMAIDEMTTVLQHFNAQVQAHSIPDDSADAVSSGPSATSSDGRTIGGGESDTGTGTGTGTGEATGQTDSPPVAD